LGIRNVFPSLPTRADQYKDGPGDVSLTSAIKTISGTANTNSADADIKMSKDRFIYGQQPYPNASPK
jgi:hypothetical protein